MAELFILFVQLSTPGAINGIRRHAG